VEISVKRCLECNHTFQAEKWLCPACAWTPAIQDEIISFAPDLANVKEGWDPEFSGRLAEMETNHFWFRARNNLVTWAIGRYFPEAENFFEVGCGTGFVLSGIHRSFPGFELSGSDGAYTGLQIARQRCPSARFLQMDARKIPFREEFDVIGAFDVLEHIEEDQEVINQIYQALKPGGGLLISVPQHRFLWSVVDDYSYHKRRYSRSNLTQKLERSNFRVVHATSFVSLMLPLLLASRLMMMPKQADQFNPETEFKVGKLTGKVLESILRWELAVTRAGFSWPAGGSLFIVATR
jgi:SAM-dependent methyltransferase